MVENFRGIHKRLNKLSKTKLIGTYTEALLSNLFISAPKMFDVCKLFFNDHISG